MYVSISKIFAVFTIHILLFAISGVCYGDRNQEGSVSNERLGEKSFYLSICDGLISLDAQEADLREILTEISNRTRVVIEIGAGVEDSITTSFCNIPLDEALKKITSNWAMVFLKEKGQNVEHLSKVVILAGSQDMANAQAKSKTDNHNSFKPPSANPIKPVTPTTKTSFQKISSASLTLTNEKTGLKSNVVPNELIVRFKKGLFKEDIQSLVAATKATVKTYIEALNYYLLSLPPDLSVNDVLRWYRRQDVVDQAEPNYLIPLKTVPNDPDFSRQWALHNTGQTGGTDDADIDAAESWDIEQGNGDVIIAIIDTGVDYTHEDLAATHLYRRAWVNFLTFQGKSVYNI